jgi:ligand-binding sensor protein
MAVKDLDTIEIADVFDMGFLQEFQDSFARAVGMTAVTVDRDGHPVTHPTDWTDFCMKFTRSSQLGCQRCEAGDKHCGEEAARMGKPFVYECHAGLMDFGAPIMLQGHQIGSILGGQVITEPLQEEKYRKYAEEIGVDPEAYVEAARKVEMVPRKRLDEAANTLFLMAGTLSKVGYFQYRLKAMSANINDTVGQVSAAMEELAASAHDVDENQKQLNDGIKDVAKVSSKIIEFTELIRNIAKQTRLLGLNASIEAARAGAAGAGFGVVAEEIGKLADNSSEAVDKIQEFTGKISESVQETVSKGESTSEIADQQSKAIEESAQNLVGLSETSSELYDLAHKE